MDVTVIPLEHDYRGRVLRDDCMDIAQEILKQWNLEMTTGYSSIYGHAEYDVHKAFEKKDCTIGFIICTDKKRKIVYDVFSEYCPIFETDFNYDTSEIYDQDDYDELEKRWVTLMDAITEPAP